MNELIPIRKSKGGRDVVSALELHQFLEVGTRIDIWFNRRVEEYIFVQGVDYQGSVLDNGFTDYIITLDMAKELAMVERNEKGQQLRHYFIWAEKRLLQLVIDPPVFRLPGTYKEALQQLITKEEQREAIEQQLALAQPKVAFFDAMAVVTHCIPIASADGGLKRDNDFIKTLREM